MGVGKPLLLLRARVGRPKAVDMVVLNGVLYVLVTGCRWMDMPVMYGLYRVALRRVKGWRDEGVWNVVFKAFSVCEKL